MSEPAVHSARTKGSKPSIDRLKIGRQPAATATNRPCAGRQQRLAFSLLLGTLLAAMACESRGPRYWDWADEAIEHDGTALLEAKWVDGLPGGNPVAFNGGLARHQNQIWLSVRVDRHKKAARRRSCKHERSVSLAQLSETYALQDPLVALNLPGGSPCDTAEDARLIVCDERLFAVYNAEFGRRTKTIPMRVRTILAEIDTSQPEPSWFWARRLSGSQPTSDQEKNWTPFCYENALHFIEQTLPPAISVLPPPVLAEAQALGRGVRVTEAPLQLVGLDPPQQAQGSINWQAGAWRGGTPALFEPALNEYVSFFHSHLNVGKHRLYYAGFYTFEATPPFAIRRYVAKPIHLPAVAPRYHHVSRVVFPMGLLVDNDHYLVSYGQDDRSIGLATFNKKDLFAGLVPAAQ